MYDKYGHLEVHVEQLVRNTHIYTHYSVGIIAAAFAPYAEVFLDIPIQSWQKHAQWDEFKSIYQDLGCLSEDEFAAMCMGRYWTEIGHERTKAR